MAGNTQAALALEFIAPLSPEGLDSLSPGDCLRRLFVAALTEHSNGAWKNVFDYLSKLSVSERHKLSKEPDILHYGHRTVHYADTSEAADSHDIVHSLRELLPGVVEQCRKESRSASYNLPLSTSVTRCRDVRRRRTRKRVVSLDSGLSKLLTYSPKLIPATFRGPDLQLSELTQAATAVSHELTVQNKTTSALSPSHLFPHPSTTSPPHHHKAPKPALSPVYRWQLNSDKESAAGVKSLLHSGPCRKIQFEEATKAQKDKSSEAKLHSVYDVIAAFATGSLQAGAQSVYLNPCPGSPWNPYNLCVVPKTRANPEHYLISKFGILHVQPDSSSNLQSFADWLLEAGLFSLCRRIPYFRQFLLRKMFRCWHRNVCYHQFVRLYSEVNRVGLRFFPDFHDAIDAIHKLNTELLSIPTHNLTPLGGYSTDALEKNSEGMEAKTRRLLQRYFKYCKRVVSEAIRAVRMQAEKLEEEKKHQPFVSDSPISVQVQQHAELERKLGVARYRASRLTDFVRLTEQMMATCLLQMARQSGRGWVEGTLHLNDLNKAHASSSSLDTDDRGTPITEEGSDITGAGNEKFQALLIVDLKIGEKGGVLTEPSEEKIALLMTNPLHSITSLLSSCSSTLTSGPTHSHHTLPHLPTSVTGGGVKGDNVKVLLASGRGRTKYKPLMQALKGINSSGNESGPGSVLESFRARSRLEGVGTQGAEVISREEEYSNPDSPLVPQKMKSKLQQDPVLQALCGNLQEAVDRLQSEVSATCQRYSWLDQAHSLIAKCRREKTSDMSAQSFESVLSELHSALYRISHLPPLLPTSHSLITISTVGVASLLAPQLCQAVARLQKSLATQALHTVTQLLRDTAQHTQMLSVKRFDLEGFVQYARSLRESQAFHTREASNTQWVSDVHGTLRKYSIQTSEVDREMMLKLQGVWKEFEVHLADGEQFVKMQTPIKAQGLQESIAVLDEQLEQLLLSASEGDFTDPSATPHLLLPHLESIHQEMSGIRSRLMGLSKWEEALTGKHNELSRMFHCFDVFYARQELWKYRRQFDSCEYDWYMVPFKKLDITYLEQKVSEWWKVCGHLGRTLPPDDPVLEQWREKVERMHTSMPTLQLLASRTLQTSHWHTIFAAFNEQYESPRRYTLYYFLGRDLEKFSDIVTEVHRLASQQSRLREKFLWMEQQWEEKAIDLCNISTDRYSFCLPRKSSSQRQMTITFFNPSEAPARSGTRGQEPGRDQLHSVQGGEKLAQEIEAAVLELKVMLSSPHLGDLNGKVELLRSSLQQVNELFSLIMQCQDQWRDLLELFLYIKPVSRKSSGLQRLQSASSHYKEVMDSIHSDPRVFSLLSKSRGQKGARDLQGLELGKKLRTVLNCMEEVMTKLDHRLDEAVCHWPRLGYLTKRQKLKTLSHRGDLLPIIPLINRVFPAIKTLRFVETSSSSDRDSSTGYQVTGVVGVLREHLCLVLPLPLEQKPAVEWLAALEQAVRFSLASRFTDCLSRLPRPFTGQPLAAEGAVLEWLGGHVQQNILLALDVHWSTRLLQACSDRTRTSLQTLCSQLQRATENTVQLLLRETTQQHEGGEGDGEKRDLTSHVLRSAIIYLRRKADFAHSLLPSDTADPDSSWRLHLHYTAGSSLQANADNEAVSRLPSRNLGSSRSSPADSPRGSLTASRSSLPSPRATKKAGLPDSGMAHIKLPAHLSPLGRSSSSQLSSPASVHSGDHLQISPPSPCTVHSGGPSVAYGFEYYGPTPQVVMTPTMESGVVAMAAAIMQYSFPGVTGERESQKTETAKEVAKLLGRHHYHHTCSHLTTPVFLLHVIHTAVSCGSILTLEDPHCLPTSAQLRIRHYLYTLQSALATCFVHDTVAQPNSQSEPNPLPSSDSHQSRIASSRLDWYGSTPLPLPPSLHRPPQSLDYMGRNITVSLLFGCAIILAPDRSSNTCLSHQHDSGLRGVVCMKPDKRLVAEVLMASYGFSTAYRLSKTLVILSNHLQSQLSVCSRGVQFNLSWLHKVISLAAHLLQAGSDFNYYNSEETMEERVVCRAVLRVTTPLIIPDQTARLTDIVVRHLPSYEAGGGASGEGEEVELVRAVEDEMKERHLQIQPEVTEKIVQLHRSLDQYSCTVLLGPRGSGITSCYRTLSAAYKRMGKSPTDIIAINPAAYSWEQLFGGYGEEAGPGEWSDGILTKLLLKVAATESHRAVESHPDRMGTQEQTVSSLWVVLDGPLTPSLLDSLTSLMSDGGLCLPGMERVHLPSSCRLLLKPGPVPPLSPGLLGSCGLLHWSHDTLTYDMLIDSWLEKAPTQHDLNRMSISYLGSALQTMVPNSVQYLDTVCSKHYGHLYTTQAQRRNPGIAETLSLLSLLSAVLERNCPTRGGTTIYGSRASSSRRSSVLGSALSSRCGSAMSRTTSMVSLYDLPQLDETSTDDRPSEMDFNFLISEPDSVEAQLLSILAFAFIWSIGAYVPFSEVDSFSEFAVEQISEMPLSVSFPEDGCVFDYYLDLQTYRFDPWSKRKGRLMPRHSNYIPTPELSRVAYVAELYLSYGYNVMLVGERGSGKTSFTEFMLQSNMSLTRFAITRSLSAPHLHTAISSKVSEATRKEKMRWGSRKVGIIGQRCLFFLDDLHLGCRSGHCDLNSPSPASIVEMVSFVSRHCCLFGYPDDTLCFADNVQYIASCLPGHQYTDLPQLLRSFHPVPFFPPSDKSLHSIFSTSVLLWFKKFPKAAIEEPEVLANALSVASITTFRSVCTHLQPSITHPQWFISLQHLMNVYKGLVLMPLDSSKIKASTQFSLLNRRPMATTTSNYGRTRKRSASARKPSRMPDTARRGSMERMKSARPVRLPPMKKGSVSHESNLQKKIKSELKGKKQHHDIVDVQAMLYQLVRLWCHENTRVYADRMTDSKDRLWFLKLLETCVKYCFCGVGFAKTTATLPSDGTAARGVRRGRGVRSRAGGAAHSQGLSLSDLVASGVRADVLQSLLPREGSVAEGEGGGTEGEGESGQVIPFDQVIMRGEDITGLIFCKLPAVRASSARSEDTSDEDGTSSSDESETEDKGRENKTDPPAESVYQELGDGQVMEAMEKHIHCYSVHTARQNRDNLSIICPVPDLILFQGAMEHAVRLCRIMIIPGCHALLLGVSGSGRKSLCRFVAYMMRAQLFEITDDEEASDFKEPLKKAYLSAATDHISPTVLFVSCTGQRVNTQMWSTISQLMSAGTCCGLLTNIELICVQNMLKKDHPKRTTTPQIIAKLVQRNLHVVISWDISRTTGSLISTSCSIPVSRNGAAESAEEVTRDVYSALCSQCSVVDHYHTWGGRELSELAQKWWKDKTCSLRQGWITSESQLESLANLAAHAHLSTLSVLDEACPHLPSLLLSPASFTQCLTMAHGIAGTLQQEGKGSDERLCSALEKLVGAEDGERAMKAELAALEPELSSVQRKLEEKNRHIEACQERYRSASQQCREAKAVIDSNTQTVEELRSTVAEKMDQVSSLHCSAMEALSSVKKNDVLEVMSYREPPASAVPVFNTLCMLFDRPQTWEDCKQLLLSPNFFESLKFFDKDGVPRHKLRQLKSVLRSPVWRVESLQHASRAVSSLAMWVAALLDYHHARDVVKPFKDKLATAEKILTEAEVRFVAMQRDMLDTKAEFKGAQKERNKSLRQKTSIETNIADVQQRLRDAGRLLSILSPWKSCWEEDRAAIHTHALSSPGHAVLTAASVTYLTKVPADRHRQLWDVWLGYCEGRVRLGCLVETASQPSHHSHSSVVQIEPDFSPKSILSVEAERSHWSHYASFPNTVVLERCLAARTALEKPFSPLPLVLDPQQLFQCYAHELEFCHTEEHATREGSMVQTHQSGPTNQPASCVVVLRVSAAGWAQALCEWEERRERVMMLILDEVPSTNDRETLKTLLRRRSEGWRTSWDQSIPSDQLLRLYLVLEEHIRDSPSPVLWSLGLSLLDFNVVNMELSTTALQSHLLKLTLRIEHPEYAVRHRALMVDRTFFEKQIEGSKENVIVSVLDAVNLLDCPSIADIVEESKQKEATALDSIHDTNKALGRSRGLVDSYRLFSLSSALIFSTAQKLCIRFGYRNLTLTRFLELMEALLARHKHIRPPDNPAACKGHVLHLQNKLLLELHQHLKLCMLQRHHILLPLFTHMARLLAAGKISREEYQALGEDSGPLQSQLDVLASQEGSAKKPAWLSQQNWSDIHLLEKVPVFQNLASSVSHYSEGWREYCGMDVCLTTPTPLHPTPPTIYQAMLLWRALNPDKFHEVVEEFVSLSLGPEFTSWGANITSQDPLDHILSTVPPCTPIACLVPSEQDEDTAARILREAAREKGVAYHHLEMEELWDGDKALLQLGVWSGEGGWVVIGQSYLQSNPRKTWQQLTKTLRENDSVESSKLQLWLMVLLSHSARVDPSWPCVVLEDHSTLHLTGQGLLADVRLMVTSDSGLPSASTGSVRPPLASLRQLLPAPLSHEEINDLSPTAQPDSGHLQTIVSFLYQELQHTNRLLLSIHASLQWISERSAHPFQLSSRAAQAVAEMAENKIPQLWSAILPAHLASLPSLLLLVQLLQGSVDYLISTIKGGWSLSVKLHPLWVSNPTDLMSRVQHWFAEVQQIPPSEVTLMAEVSTSSQDPPSHSQDPSLMFHGLSLCGATWDRASSTLTPSPAPPSHVCVTLTPVPIRSQRTVHHIYQCPVYSTADHHHIVLHIPLLTSSPSLTASLHCFTET